MLIEALNSKLKPVLVVTPTFIDSSLNKEHHGHDTVAITGCYGSIQQHLLFLHALEPRHGDWL